VSDIAPISLFVYNRTWHTRQTVKVLLHNNLSKESIPIIFSDAPKTIKDEKSVNELRDYIHNITWFKSTRINKSDKNLD